MEGMFFLEESIPNHKLNINIHFLYHSNSYYKSDNVDQELYIFGMWSHLNFDSNKFSIGKFHSPVDIYSFNWTHIQDNLFHFNRLHIHSKCESKGSNMFLKENIQVSMRCMIRNCLRFSMWDIVDWSRSIRCIWYLKRKTIRRKHSFHLQKRNDSARHTFDKEKLNRREERTRDSQ
jgi:hypothetical protein